MRYLCLDTGGTSIKYALGDQNGNLKCLGKLAVGTSRKEFLDKVEELYGKFAPVDGIACSFPGEVHSDEGVIYGISAVEQLHGCMLKQLISERCGHSKVSMLNDANAAALGELWMGVGRNHRNAAFVIVGSGVGGAVIEDGKLYSGTTRNKAEIGNFLMGGIKDGIWQTWSDFTLEKEARRYSEKSGLPIDGITLLAMARAGDEEAAEYVEEFFHYMATGCVNIEFAYDPEIIAIGGGISGDPWIIEEIKRHYETIVAGQRFGYIKAEIIACEHQNRANLLGALYYFLNDE